MLVEIVEAGIDALPVIQNLITLYIYDLSEIMGWACPEHGLFGGCDELPQYWGMEPSRPEYRLPEGWQGHPFLARVDGELAGFVLVRQAGEDAHPKLEIGDFFILRKFRGKGVGRRVAHAVFDRFRGDWDVAEMVGNAPAQAFWRKVISEYTNGGFTESSGSDELHGMELVVQSFANR